MPICIEWTVRKKYAEAFAAVFGHIRAADPFPE